MRITFLHRSLAVGISTCALLCTAMLSTPSVLGAAPSSQPNITANFKFRDIGPAVAGGRVTSVVGAPGNPNVIYVGSAGGGVWKSTDGGDSWKALLTHADTSSIGVIALAPSNPNLVWVGTGESNVRNDTLTGAGVYYSPDRGKTWEFKGLKEAGQISAIVVDPMNPAIVLVAVQGDPWGPNTERGVFRTDNGGKTWQKVLFVDDKTGASSLIMEPGNPQVLFAGMWTALRTPWNMVNGSTTGGVWRSTDGGLNWTKLTEGLPTGDTGRITLAAAPSNPEHIYALIPTKTGTLWSSEDLGAHWTMVSNNHALAVRQWYFAGMAVAPNDQNRVYFASLNLMESDDGGKTAHAIDRSVHVDHHAVWVDPDNPGRIIQGNDGGAYLSVNGGKNWRFLDTLPIEQAYTVSLDEQSPFHACVGLQDNSAWCGPTSSLDQGEVTGKHWSVIPAGDGQYAVIAPSDPDIVYADGEDGYITRTNLRTHLNTFIRPNASYGLQNSSKTLAESQYRFNWTSPIAVSPSDVNTVYLGAQVLFKSTDGGQQWTIISPDLTRDDKSKQGIPGGPVYHDVSSAENYDTLLSITLAPTDPNKVIWVGSDDGLVHVTQDGGTHWTNVTPKGAPEWARVYQIGVSPFDAGTAYVSFDAHMTDDDRAYVYRTDNYGKSWTSITSGLPAHTPVLVVREDANRKGLLIAGTMTGLYYSLDDGNQWRPLTGNLPTTPVFDLQFARATHSLAVATHGRGLFVLDNLQPLEEWQDSIADSVFHSFAPQRGTLYNDWSSDQGQQWRYTVHNAPAGVVFSYWLKRALKPDAKDKNGPVKIVIKNAQGQTINTLHAPGKAGLNEFVWDMDYAGPTKIDFLKGAGGGEGGGGPSVLPGTYTASIFVDDQTYTQALSVRLDPNVHANIADYRARLELGLELRNQTSAANELLNRLTAWQQALDTLTNAAPDHAPPEALADNAKALGAKIAKLKDQLWNPGIQHDVGEDFLKDLPRFHGALQWNSMYLGGYAQRPAPYVAEKYAELHQELQGYLDQFNQLLSTDVPAYNKAAYAAGEPTLATGKPIVYQAPQLPTQ